MTRGIPPKNLTIPPQGKRKFSIILEACFMENETDEQVAERDSAIINHILNYDKNNNQY